MTLLNVRPVTLLMLIMSMTFSLGVLADCVYISGAGGGEFRSFNGPASITVNKSDLVGKILFQERLMTRGARTHIRCTAGTYTYRRGLTYPAATVAGFTNVYTTGVPGIGMRFRFLDGSPSFSESRTYSRTTDLGISSADYVQVEIIKTHDNVVPGTIQAQQAYQDIVSGSGIFPPSFMVGNYYSTTRILVAASPTCDLAAGDVNRTITLNNVRVSDFNNASSAGARDFELTATCSDASRVTFAFSGTPAPGDSYRFANTGTAQGIGLRLYSRIGGVAQTIRADGTDSRRTVAVSGNRAVLPLGASYWKIGTVSKGTLASTATVSITYD